VDKTRKLVIDHHFPALIHLLTTLHHQPGLPGSGACGAITGFVYKNQRTHLKPSKSPEAIAEASEYISP
jgi:hypothetical protein